MAKFVSNYPGTLVLPSDDGKEREIVYGQEINLSKDEAQNAGVAEWLAAGWLIEAGKVKVAAPAVDAEALQVTVTALTAELEAERAKTAELDAIRAQNAELAAKVTELEAALAEATKPAGT